MSASKYLFEELPAKAWGLGIQKPRIPDYITTNLKYDLFKWQKEGLANFLTNEEIKRREENQAPTHLLFNMATGTGKTLLMAALILYYYKQGYRHFIFFVNQNNIVGKTEENLLNRTHNKFLFKDTIVIDNRTVRLKKVETFSNHTEDIQLLFTSIQTLHNAIYTVKENSVYLDDLQKRKIVMLGDEAHHLNADTKKKGAQIQMDLPIALSGKASETDLEKSWESTIIKKILYKGQYLALEKNENVLLEFTATVPREESVKEKYFSKLIYRFDLKDFLKAGYTKEINLVSSNSGKRNRILQALLFNWYRYKIALKYGLQNFKPVILFRSKLIADSKKDFEEFKELIGNLTVKDFGFLNSIAEEKAKDGTEIYNKGKSRIVDIKYFIGENNIEWAEIIAYLQYTFAERNCIITNSKEGTKTIEKTDDEQNKLLNSLEDKSNKISAIFTVQRLTEGWDVLNLFDIVRLYEGQNEGGKNTKTSEATTSEVQLIGRGVRYYPFAYNNKPILKRKFDDNLDHELRVLEEFYYHSDDEHRYLSQLKNELKNKGYIDDKRKIKKFAIKKEFKKGDLYKKICLWMNDQKQNPARRKSSLEDIKKDFAFTDSVGTANTEETRIEMDQQEDTARYITKKEDGRTLDLKLKDFERHIIRKAINIKATKDGSLLRFGNLNAELKIESVDDILEDNFLGDFSISITVPKTYKGLDDISNGLQLQFLLRFFDKIEKSFKEIWNPFIGSAFYTIRLNSVFDSEKEKLIEEDDASKVLETELLKKDWYLLDAFNGTSEERSLISFLTDTMANLEDKYEQVFLLRNEEVYTIYDFDKGRGFQPDFLLFLKRKRKNLYYQVFIEPKGDQFKDSTGNFTDSKEAWKETFLEQISMKHGISNLLQFESKDYKLIGLPLYNEKRKEDFRKKYNKVLELSS